MQSNQVTKPAGSHIVQSMADEMRRLGEGCTRDDLLMLFTAEELDQHGAAARAKANADAVYQRRARVPARAA